jgi:signal transduction histidine kinase
MSPDLTAFALAGGTTAVVGAAGALVVGRLARRSVPAATVSAPLVVIVSMAAGVLVCARAMFLSEHDIGLVLIVLAATVPVALVVGVLLSRQVRAADRRAAAEAAARAKAEALDASRREMVAWVSHDLRTPLAGIRAMAEALEDGVAADPHEYHRRIGRETDRLAGMVDDLLALTSLHAGTTRLELTVVSLADLVSDTLATIRPLAQRLGVVVDGSADGPVAVRGDARQLSRALVNLVDNAVRHTPGGGQVVVTASRDATLHCARLRVHDECGGIPPEDLAHLTEPGWRGSAARSPGDGRGAGLGLAVVEGIAKAHGGSLSVVNDGLGCLATVEVPTEPS